MNALDIIKVSLQSNPNLNDEIRNKLFGLVTIFHKKLPEINLAKLNEKLKTVKNSLNGCFFCAIIKV